MKKPYNITYGGMLLGQEEIKVALKAIKENYWPLGKQGVLMEQEAAKFLGVKHGILANSGSSAGLLALSALELPSGSEVIIPATTFPTIFNIILQCGLVPVVIDSKVGSYNLSPAEIEGALSKKTKAIICVHAVGNPVDMVAVMKIAKKHNLYVIEDNCDGWGSSIAGKKVGSFGHVSFTSFHAAHIVSMGQGGGVFTNDSTIARNARMYRDWGRQAHLDSRTNTKWDSLPKDYDSRFIYEKVGFNISPLEMQAAIGRVQLRKANTIKKLRQRNFNYIHKHLRHQPWLIMPRTVRGADVCWFSFPLTYIGDRGTLIAYLERYGIETRSMFAGDITKHPAYKKVKYRKVGKLPGAQHILTQSFWVSVHPRYSTRDLDYMLTVFDAYFTKYHPHSADWPTLPRARRGNTKVVRRNRVGRG